MNVKKLFVAILVGLSAVSCSKQDFKEKRLSSYRTEFVSNKTQEEIKANFEASSFEVKQNLWKDKLDDLLYQDIPNSIRSNIEVVRDFVEKRGEVEDFSEFKRAVIELSKSIPLEDFIQMFTSLENYDYTNEFKGTTPVPDSFRKYIEEDIVEKKPLPSYGDCTCRWCLFIDKSFFSSRCKETKYGCGFLFLQSCTKSLLSQEIDLKKDKERSFKKEPIVIDNKTIQEINEELNRLKEEFLTEKIQE